MSGRCKVRSGVLALALVACLLGWGASPARAQAPGAASPPSSAKASGTPRTGSRESSPPPGAGAVSPAGEQQGGSATKSTPARLPVRVGQTTVTVIDENESVDDVISRVRAGRGASGQAVAPLPTPRPGPAAQPRPGRAAKLVGPRARARLLELRAKRERRELELRKQKRERARERRLDPSERRRLLPRVSPGS